MRDKNKTRSVTLGIVSELAQLTGIMGNQMSRPQSGRYNRPQWIQHCRPLYEYLSLQIAFEFYQIVDGGHGLLTGGLRVHPDYRGQGIAEKLEQNAQPEVEKQYPDCYQNHMYTASDEKFQRRRLAEDPEHFRLMLTRVNVVQ